MHRYEVITSISNGLLDLDTLQSPADGSNIGFMVGLIGCRRMGIYDNPMAGFQR